MSLSPRLEQVRARLGVKRRRKTVVLLDQQRGRTAIRVGDKVVHGIARASHTRWRRARRVGGPGARPTPNACVFVARLSRARQPDAVLRVQLLVRASDE